MNTNLKCRKMNNCKSEMSENEYKCKQCFSQLSALIDLDDEKRVI